MGTPQSPVGLQVKLIETFCLEKLRKAIPKEGKKV